MNILAWVVFGLVVGVIANYVDPKPSYGGIAGAVILGIVGSLVGGFLSSLLLGVGVTGFNIPSIIIGVLGSLLLLLISRSFRRL